MLIIAAVLLVLFGRGKVSTMMGEVGKGIAAFRKGVKDGAAEEAADPLPAPQLIEKA
jgi:sec-independent protein translocase protein TatA